MKKRLLSILLTLCMVLMLLPQAAFAEDSVKYLDASGAEQTRSTYDKVDKDSTSWNDGWYVVQGEVTIEGTVTTSGDVHLILADGCTLTVDGGIKAYGNLTIYAQSTGGNRGSMTANGPDGSTESYGIFVNGSITINGGSVKAVGGQSDSRFGIYANNVTINGGSVQAEAEINSIAADDSVTITGGSVQAEGGIYASKSVTITGGSVHAEGEIQASDNVTINGSGAMVFASSISGERQVNRTNGIVFEGDECKVYGTSVTPSADFTIPADKTLTVEAGQTLTIPAGVTLTIEEGAALTNNGTINNGGTIIGTVSGNQPRIFVSVDYLDKDGKTQTCSSAMKVTGSDTEWEAGWYVVQGEVTIGSCVTVDGDVHLILTDGCKLILANGLVAGKNLTVYAQSTGNAQGSMHAVGPSEEQASYLCISVAESFTINGGNIKAESGDGGVGSYAIDANDVIINGGIVMARGGDAGIGSYGIYASSCATINGGIVMAEGGQAGYGSHGVYAYDVTINGGIVFEGNNGIVYGASVTPSADFTIPAGKTLTVEAGQTLTIPEGVTLTIEEDGTLINNGALTNYGTIVNSGTLTNDEVMTNNGTIISSGTINGTISGNQPKVCVSATYLDENGEKQTCSTAIEMMSSDTKWTTGWYVVGGEVNIDSRVTVSGDVRLILADGCTFTVDGGIQVQDDDNDPQTPSTNALTIYAQSVPVLNADGTVDEANNKAGKLIARKVGDSDLNAAIGGNGSDNPQKGSGFSGGTITINGGIVEATSYVGAGIGGGSSGTGDGTGNLGDAIGGSSGSITINGGKVTAISEGGAGIGGGGGRGSYKDNGTIIINGGTVTASSVDGAGIGGGCRGSGGKTTITGGNVTATSDTGTGIGSGGVDDGSGGEITVTGGNVTAESTRGVGIGASRIHGSVDGTITISDGTVTVIGGDAQENCYGILASSVTVNGGSVKAESGSPTRTYGPTQSYGIYAATELTINGGSVKAEGGDVTSYQPYSYGIYTNKVTISGGTVEAEGGSVALKESELASGSFGIFGSVTINGGSLTAAGGSITGAGNNASSCGISGSVTINGGHVTAQTLDTNNGHALRSAPQLPETYWWRIADNNAFTASGTAAYAHKDSDTYVEFTDSFTITLDPHFDGGKSVTMTTGTDGKLPGILPVLTRDGYTFEGWFTEAEGGTAVTGDTVFNGYVTIHAQWIPDTCTVTLRTNGGTINSGNVTEYIRGVGAVLPTDVTRTGYIFGGWYDNEALTGDPVTAIGADEKGVKEYWAKWTRMDLSAPSGWKEFSSGSSYYKNGLKVKGLQQIDGKTYYFDEKGYLQTGWVELDGCWYYFDSDLQTGWVKVDGHWYFLDPDTGVMAENSWVLSSGVWYYLGGSGAMLENQWVQWNGVWYYLGEGGAMLANRWLQWNGAWYYLGTDGTMLANRWLQWNGAWYYLGTDGAMLTNIITPDGYKVDASGVWVK